MRQMQIKLVKQKNLTKSLFSMVVYPQNVNYEFVELFIVIVMGAIGKHKIIIINS